MRGGHDAIIVGGGPAGATAAILLAQSGWRIAVVEKAVFPRRKVCGEFISAATWPLLRELGIADALSASAGPAVRRVGVFAATARLTAPIAARCEDAIESGRAIGREILDTVLLDRAREAGAEVWQPWHLGAFAANADGYACRIEEQGGGRTRALHAPIVIAAHGSWESGPLPTQNFRKPPCASDLLAFKARFLGGELPEGLMPLIGFAGGYGGMVRSGDGRVSLSCCIRRDYLESCRRQWPQRRAGAAVLAYISGECAGVAAALSAATLDGAWLAAGPIQPGIRGFGRDGVFTVGNAAAEAHPIIAEGISMAIQSASLLCEQLLARRGAALTPDVLAAVRRDYAIAWRRNFSRRLHVAALFAHLFMRPATTRAAIALLRQFPSVLTQGARWSGKVEPLRSRRSLHAAGTICR